MDSMRSLNTSLPAAYSSRPVPREQLLQAFKTAALSVTNLYKSAAADQQSSRDAGYQDALEDLLRMMDSENLGVQDGEGWRIRQWVTERYDHSANNTAASDTDDNRTTAADPGRDDAVDEDTSADRGSLNDASSDTEVPERHEQLPLQRPDSAPPMFKFTAGQSSSSSSSSNPDNDAMQVNDGPSKPVEEAEPVLPPPPPIQVQLINRANRTAQRNNNQRHGRPSGRTPASTAGTKRKLYQVPDFFDIPNFNFRDDPDNGSGSKRSRMV
ncbi:hypothetical protein DV738_g1833, partial [Chaetothyriales sp. CBS 135597]